MNTNTNTNTPRLRRGGRDIFFSCSSLVLLVLVLLYITVQYILFVTQLPSWSDGLYFLFGVFLPSNLLLVFPNLVFLGTTCYTYFFASVGTFSGCAPYSGLVCDHGDSSLCPEE